ncbi:MAG: hypothetical protein LBH29_01325 [Elusimicrobiota bacterium]|jgi:hypothetical protein|nr:hypothetical protein [Elusimicrobiota bacterium]
MSFDTGVYDAAFIASAKKAQTLKETLLALGANIAKSKTRERLPSAFQTLHNEAVKNSAVETLYIKAEDFNQVFMQQGLTAEQIAQAANKIGAKNYMEAAQTDGDIVFDGAKLIEAFAATKDFEVLTNYIRNNPEDLSAADIKRITESLNKISAENEKLLQDSGIGKGNEEYERIYEKISKEMAAVAPPKYNKKQWDKVSRETAALLTPAIITTALRQGKPIQETADRLIPNFISNAAKAKTEKEIITEMLTAQSGRMNAFNQPLLEGIDLKEKVKILDLTNDIKNKVSQQDVKQYIENIINSGQKIETLSENWLIDLLKQNEEHILGGKRAFKRQGYEEARHKHYLNLIDKLIANSVLIESVANTKQDKKPNVLNYHYFYTPIRIGNEVFTVKLFAEENKGDEKQNGKTTVHLSDVIDISQQTIAAPAITSNLGTRSGDEIIISEMLKNAKDADGNFYFQGAWHGTHAKGITEFSNDKIGSGEGAQAFGWGHYAGGIRKIGEYYRKVLTIDTGKYNARQAFLIVKMAETGKQKLLKKLRLDEFRLKNLIHNSSEQKRQYIQEKYRWKTIDRSDDVITSDIQEELEDIEEDIKFVKEYKEKPKGQLYKLEIPESEDFLQWDKPIEQQSDKVKKALKEMFQKEKNEFKIYDKEVSLVKAIATSFGLYEVINPADDNIDGYMKHINKQDGGWLYQQLQRALQSDKAASLKLLEYGILGNEYPAGTYSGKTNSEARNFVLFDPKLIEIKKTYYKRADGENSRIKEAENTANKEAKEVLMNPVKIAERFITLQKVINSLKKLAGKEIKNIQTGITAQVNSIQIHKIVSNKAVEKSILNGFTRNQHYLAASVIDKLFENAILKETTKDKNNDVNIKSIKRFNAITEFENEAGKTEKGIAYLTLKESIKAGHRIYSIELQKIERLQGRLNNSNEGDTLASTHTAPPGASGGLSPTISNNNAAYSATAYNTVSASGIKSLISDSTPTAHNRSVNESFYQGQGNIKKQNDDVKYSRAETFDNSLIPADTINNSAQDETNQNKAQEKPVGQFKTLKDKIFNEKRYRQFLDRGHSIDILEKKAQKLGVKTDVYKQFRLNAGGVGRAKSALLYGTYSLNKDGNIEWNGEGLQQIINDAKKISDTKNTDEIMQDLHDCLIAKRYIADLMQRKDVDVTKGQLFKSNKTMFRLMKEYGNSDKIEGIANRLYEYQKRVLHILVDGGVLTQKQYNRIVELNPHYVPLQRIIDEAETNGVKNLGVKAIYNIKGSDKAEKNIFESIIKNTYTIIESANNNRLIKGIKAIIQKDADFKAYFASGASFGSFMDMSDANLAKIAKGMIAANSRKINMGKIWKYTMGNLGRKRIARRNPC